MKEAARLISVEPTTRPRATIFRGLYSTRAHDPAEAHWTAPEASTFYISSTTTNTIQPAIHEHNVNLYPQTANTHICLQAVQYWHFKREPPMLNMSPPDGDTAHGAVSRCSTVSHSPNFLTNAHSEFSLSTFTNNHEVGFHTWVSSSRCRRTRQGWGVGGKITRADPRKDQPKTNRELLTLSWVRPNHLNLLTQSVPPPSPKACWCDLSICSQRSEEV